MNETKFKAIDLFAGIGGMRLGFEKAGFGIVYANDFDPDSCRTYRANFGEIDERDIKDVETGSLPDFDVLLGGFPCQPFSMIGKKKGLDDERAKSFFHIIRFLTAKQPKAFVLENVKHLQRYEGGAVYARIKKALEWAGYKVKEAVLNSKDFGVPQNRERLYMVGLLDHSLDFRFPRPTRKKPFLSQILESDVDEFYYLTERYYRGLLKHKKRQAKSGNGFGCAVLDVQGISNTLVAGNMGRERNLIRDRANKKNRWGIRRLTIRECAGLQGFPKRFKFPVSVTKSYVQLGNAVTVNVGKSVAISLRNLLVKPTRYREEKVLFSASAAPSEFAPGKLQKATAT